jgi:hypothetical protein
MPRTRSFSAACLDHTQKKRSAGAVIRNIGGIEEHNRRLTDRTFVAFMAEEDLLRFFNPNDADIAQKFI